jgi:L-lactate permease
VNTVMFMMFYCMVMTLAWFLQHLIGILSGLLVLGALFITLKMWRPT